MLGAHGPKILCPIADRMQSARKRRRTCELTPEGDSKSRPARQVAVTLSTSAASPQYVALSGGVYERVIDSIHPLNIKLGFA